MAVKRYGAVFFQKLAGGDASVALSRHGSSVIGHQSGVSFQPTAVSRHRSASQQVSRSAGQPVSQLAGQKSADNGQSSPVSRSAGPQVRGQGSETTFQDQPSLAMAIDTASAFSPWVEPAGADLVLLDLSGLTKQWPEETQLALAIKQKFEEQNLRAYVAIASNRIAAQLLARGCAGATVVPDGQEKPFLAPLPLELLTPPEELQQVFDRWGLKTLGDLMRLPKNSLAQRLGERGIELYLQACGVDNTPLTPCAPAETFETFFAFDWPLENSEPLAFTLNRLLERLCAQLASASLAAEAVGLWLELANRTTNERLLRFGFSLRDPAAILSLLRLDLQARPPEAAINSLLVRLYPAPLRPVQFSLIEPPLPAPEKLARTLAKLAALVGEENIGSPVLLDTHRPDAFEMRVFRISSSGFRVVKHPSADTCPGTRNPKPETQWSMALRLFRPPLPARVTTVRLRPAALETPMIQGRVIQCGGPWRSSGDWWENKRWARDAWDVLLSNGGLYRLYRDLQNGEWFVDGVYD